MSSLQSVHFDAQGHKKHIEEVGSTKSLINQQRQSLKIVALNMPKVPHSLGSHNSGLGLQEQSPILIDLADISLVVLVQTGAEFRDDVVLVSATDLIAELLANVLLRHSRASDLVIIIGFGSISVCN